MRGILFRGKRIDNQEWAYGALIMSQSKCYILLSVTDHIKRDDYEVYMVEVIPETVGQYTGLKDKNGKDIYEGDVYIAERSFMPSRGHLRKGYPRIIKVICVVEWSIYDAGWRDKEIGPIPEHREFDKNCPYHYFHTSLSGSTTGKADWMEVVGNIHDNPEYLK